MHFSRSVLIPPRKEKICAVIVAYFPDDDFRKRLGLIRAQIPRVVIIDNTPPEAAQNLSHRAGQFNGCHLISNTHNLGSASAMNQGANWAIENGYDWAIFFDQDTVVAPEMIASLLDTYAQIANPKVAVLGCNYHDPTLKKPVYKHGGGQPWEIRLEVIASGSLISLKAWEEVEGFREAFFIDCVDEDFCFKCSSRGYLVALCSKVLMSHTIGNSRCYHVFGFPHLKLLCSHHPPFRKYFMVRNQLILWSEYFLRYPQWVVINIINFLIFISKGLLLENSPLTQLKYICWGIIDAVSGKMDRRINECNNHAKKIE